MSVFFNVYVLTFPCSKRAGLLPLLRHFFNLSFFLFFFKEPAKKKIVRLNFGHSYEMICLTKGAELCMKSRFDTPQSARKQAPSQQRKTPGYALDMLSTQRTTNVDFAF